MSSNNIFESKIFKAVILSIVGLIILVFVFGLGVFVGTKKAEFSFRWADEYHRNFGGPQGGIFGDFTEMGQQFTNSNGVFGQIIKIDSSTSSGQAVLTINGRDNVEKTVLADDDTAIVYQRSNIKLSELKVGDNVVVVGEAGSTSQIHAELIRVMPAPLKPSSENSPANNLSPTLN